MNLLVINKLIMSWQFDIYFMLFYSSCIKWPHLIQYTVVDSIVSPQFGHVTINLVPQDGQNRLPETTCEPQLWQLINCWVVSILCWVFPNRPEPQRNAHSGQNRESGGTIVPHWGQETPNLAPQVIQNWKSLLFIELHFVHLVVSFIFDIIRLSIVRHHILYS